MAIGIRPTTPGIANASAPGVRSAAWYLLKPGLSAPCVMTVILATLGGNRTSGKVRLHGCRVVRFGF
jgi:hypothetical protein